MNKSWKAAHIRRQWEWFDTLTLQCELLFTIQAFTLASLHLGNLYNISISPRIAQAFVSNWMTLLDDSRWRVQRWLSASIRGSWHQRQRLPWPGSHSMCRRLESQIVRWLGTLYCVFQNHDKSRDLCKQSVSDICWLRTRLSLYHIDRCYLISW